MIRSHRSTSKWYHKYSIMIGVIVVYLILIPPLSEAAVTEFTSRPSDKSYAQETFNFTLMWSYTVNGAISSSRFLNVTDGGNNVVLAQWSAGGTNVNPIVQEQIWADISDSQAQLTILTVQRSDEGKYRFEIQDTNFQSIIHDVEVIVRYPPVITHISPNQTASESDVVTLICTADGKPNPSITWTRLSDNSVVTFPLTITGKQDEGFYRCTAYNGVGNDTADVFITVQNYSPENTNLTTNLSDNIADVNTNFNLICSAQANPPAKYRIYREQQSLFNTTTGSNVPVVYTTSVTERINQVKFGCTPFNDFGDGPTAMITVTVHYPPVIITAPASQSVIEGDRATLFCNATGNPPPSITWTKQGSNSVLSTSYTLTLTNLRRGDSGTVYKCKVQNNLGSDESTAMIIVLYPPEIITAPASQSVVEGNGATLFCNATGNPQPNITWTKQGNDSILSTSDTLTLTNLRRGDNGAVYKCKVQNFLGSDESTAAITVFYPPEIVSAPSPEEVVEGDGVVLFCNATGNPQPNVTWTTQGSSTVLSSSETLQLTNLISGDNGAVYICKVENIIGSRETNSTITVLYAPNVTIQQCSTPVNEGESATLYCNATGNPVPRTVWIRASAGEVMSYNKTLNLPNIKRNESGSYECKAWNGIGNNKTESCKIDVYYLPSSSALTSVPSNTTVLRGKTLSLICSTDANPLYSVTYHFYFNDGYIGNSSSGVFNVTVEADGVYTCVPINTVGTGRNATVSVTDVVASSVEIGKTTDMVIEGNNITLFCNASGKPEPSITWIRVGSSEVLTNTSSLTVVNVSRPGTPDHMIQYQCTASNGIGGHAAVISTITVLYPPQVTKPQTPTKSINFGESASIECLAEGNPQPQYKWTNAAGVVITTDKSLRLDNVDDNDGGNYTCTATNALNSDSFTIFVKVTKRRIRLEVTVEKLDGVEAVYQRDYEDLNSEPAKTFKEKFEKEMDKVYANDPSYNTTVVTGLREGSVIVSFVLYYKTAVSLNEGLAKLRFAAEKGNIGPYTVGCLKIIQDVNPTSTPVLPTGSTATVIPKGNTTPSSSECECSCNDAILGAVIGILIFIIILLIIYIVWQRRKGATGNNRPREVHLKDAGFYDNEIPMEDVEPNNFRPSNSTQQATFPGPTYMGLQEATRSGNDPTDQTVPSTLQVQRPSQSADYAPLHPSTRSWEVARDLVTIEKVIGKGAFGQVAKGTAINLRGRPGKTTVAVKMLKATAPESDRKDLLSELEVMKTLKPHRHVIKLLGCVTESEPLLVLIEYVPYGDLLGYLRKSRGLNDTYYKDPDIKPQTSLTSQQLMKFAWQIADGMSYLSSRSIIHRDLAARNVLVGEKEICKVTDFGMARDVQQENIYERKTKGRLPVKWTAYEALLFGTYTTKSDIWSYGVVLYEICTIGGSPYPRMDGRKIANMLQEGYRMPKPQHVDDKLYQIMMNCWQNEPQARPSFTALTKQLKDMENQHKKLINMHIYDNQLYAKVEDLNV